MLPRGEAVAQRSTHPPRKRGDAGSIPVGLAPHRRRAVAPIDRTQLAACLAVLARLDDPDLDDTTRLELERAVTAAARDIKRRAKARRDGETRRADRAMLAAATRFHTEIPPELPEATPATAIGTLRRDRRCYVCKTAYRQVDGDYHMLCPPCALENRQRRHARCDLSGRTAIVTGGRVKIGCHTALN